MSKDISVAEAVRRINDHSDNYDLAANPSYPDPEPGEGQEGLDYEFMKEAEDLLDYRFESARTVRLEGDSRNYREERIVEVDTTEGSQYVKLTAFEAADGSMERAALALDPETEEVPSTV